MNAEILRAKLAAVFLVDDPIAQCRCILARRHGRCVAEKGDELALALHLEAKDAVAVHFVVERNALNQAA